MTDIEQVRKTLEEIAREEVITIGMLRRAREALAALDRMEGSIEAAALERAAKMVEDEDGEYSWAGEHRNMVLLQEHSRELAAAIRALIPPAAEEEKP
jgi:hypothetical protein